MNRTVWPVFALVGLLSLFGAGRIAQAQIDSGQFNLTAGGPGGGEGDLTISAAFTKPAADKKTGELTITVEIPAGYHIYSLTQQKPLIATSIKLTGPQGAKLAGDFSADPAPSVRTDKEAYGDLKLEEHSGTVVLRAPLELPAGADPAQLKVTGTLRAQRCTDKNCLPPKTFSFTAELAPGKPDKKSPAAAGGPSLDVRTPYVGAAASKELSGDQLHATLRGTLSPAVVAAGGTARLTIIAAPQAGYHVYGYQDRDPLEIGAGKPTLIVLDDDTGFRYGRPTASVAPRDVPTPDGAGTMHIHETPVEWTIAVDVPKTTRPGDYVVSGLIGVETCNDTNCDFPQAARFEANLTVGQAASAGAAPVIFRQSPKVKYSHVAKLADERPASAEPTSPAASRATIGDGAGGVAKYAVKDAGSGQSNSLTAVLGLSLLGGLILNLMPCVLPVIGLKILSFVEQGGRSRGHILALNLWYSLGLISVFMGLAALASFAGLAWGQHFQSQTFNIVLAALVFVMALSFIGVWEIPIPGFVGAGKATQLAAREGAAGAFAKGVFTTVLATPCSGPFLGTVFGYTLNQRPEIIFLVFGCIGLGMASPYLVIGAFPSLIKFLPRPGMWMDTFKQLMGFVLLGTVVYLMTIVKPDYFVPTFAMFVGLWLACWWIGRTQHPDPFTGHTSSGAQKRAAWIGGAVTAAAIGVGAFQVLGPGQDVLDWRPFSRSELQRLTAEQKTVMVDFTAQWCPSCKFNLWSAIDTKAVRAVVDANRVVAVKADYTSYSDEITEMLQSLHSNSIPVLAIFPAGKPTEPIVLRDVVTQTQVIKALQDAGPSTAAGVVPASPAATATQASEASASTAPRKRDG